MLQLVTKIDAYGDHKNTLGWKPLPRFAPPNTCQEVIEIHAFNYNCLTIE
jgi:hypothetical protein